MIVLLAGGTCAGNPQEDKRGAEGDEEGPQEAEAALKGIEAEPILFDPPAGMAVPDEDAVAAPVSTGGFWIRPWRT